MNKIIISADELVTCPKCDHEFYLKDGITRQTIERYEESYQKQLAEEKAEQVDIIEKETARKLGRTYKNQILDLEEKLKDAAEDKIITDNRIHKAKEKAAANAKAEAADKLKDLSDDLESSRRKAKEYREREESLRKEKRQLELSNQEMELRYQRKLDQDRKDISQSIEERFKFREAELNKKIVDAQAANESLKQKLEQGSQQLQGEILELQIEELLVNAFPFDQVEEVKKGARGADVIHTVKTRIGNSCGKIVWEMKRAENWSNKWIPKLKDDQQNAGGILAVLVTTVFPVDTNEPFIQHEDVWIVQPRATHALAIALRAVLTEGQRNKAISAGRNEKAEAVYDYLCSPQFAQKVRTIVDATNTMRDDLDRERAAYARIWKKREGELERITANMLGMCGEIQGLADESLTQLESIGLLPSG